MFLSPPSDIGYIPSSLISPSSDPPGGDTVWSVPWTVIWITHDLQYWRVIYKIVLFVNTNLHDYDIMLSWCYMICRHYNFLFWHYNFGIISIDSMEINAHPSSGCFSRCWILANQDYWTGPWGDTSSNDACSFYLLLYPFIVFEG